MGIINWKTIFQSDWEKVKEETEKKKKKLEESAKQVSSFVSDIVERTRPKVEEQIVKPSKLIDKTIETSQKGTRELIDFLPIKPEYKDTISKVINFPTLATGKAIGYVLPSEERIKQKKIDSEIEKVEFKKDIDIYEKIANKQPLSEEEKTYKDYRNKKLTEKGISSVLAFGINAPLESAKIRTYGSGKIAQEISTLENELDHLVPNASRKVRGAVEYIKSIPFSFMIFSAKAIALFFHKIFESGIRNV